MSTTDTPTMPFAEQVTRRLDDIILKAGGVPNLPAVTAALAGVVNTDAYEHLAYDDTAVTFHALGDALVIFVAEGNSWQINTEYGRPVWGQIRDAIDELTAAAQPPGIVATVRVLLPQDADGAPENYLSEVLGEHFQDWAYAPGSSRPAKVRLAHPYVEGGFLTAPAVD